MDNTEDNNDNITADLIPTTEINKKNTDTIEEEQNDSGDDNISTYTGLYTRPHHADMKSQKKLQENFYDLNNRLYKIDKRLTKNCIKSAKKQYENMVKVNILQER